MPSLKKDPTTGALLKNASGALVNVCGDDCNGDPCVDCDYATHGVDPEPAQISGATSGDETWCGTIADAPFSGYSEDSDRCTWTWIGSDANSSSIVKLTYAKTNGVAIGSCGTVSIDAGEWGISTFVEDAVDPTSFVEWNEKTTGFCCNATTHKVQGTHAYTVNRCDGTACDGKPTITVDP